MKKQLAVWELISKSLQQNIPVMLMYVLESSGSSPGRAGFCMAVNVKGEMQGSIGGGIMEHKFVEMAKMQLKEDDNEYKIYKQIHDKTSLKNQSGMICSGEQSNLIYKAKPADMVAVSQIVCCINNNDKGKLRLSNKGIAFYEEIPDEQMLYDKTGEEKDDWIYEEQIGCKNRIHIIGAGHCALALSRIMSEMNFSIYVYDDRQNLNTLLENNFAHQKIAVSDYTELKTLTPHGVDEYVVVMTLGYRTDDVVIRSLMYKEFRFLGLLGSKKKIEKMFSAYLVEGIEESILKKIFAPVGLPINSQTPEEIAISIAAQIIQVKNEAGGKKNPLVTFSYNTIKRG